METSAAEQRQLRTALDAALTTTFDFGIRKLKPPRWQPALDSEASAELASVQARQDGQPDVPAGYSAAPHECTAGPF